MKRSGSWRAYAIRAVAAAFSRNIEMSGHLVVSVEVLGKTESDTNKLYTVGPGE